MPIIIFKGKEFKVCDEGCLVNADDWCPEWIDYFTIKKGIKLSDEHRRIITVARSYYEKNEFGPGTRILCREANIPFEELKILFPFGYKNAVCCMAGIPRIVCQA